MKTFQGDTMQEVLSRVKDEMGDDAVILKTRKAVRRVGGRNQPCFEVTAALEEASPRTAGHPARPVRAMEADDRPARAGSPATGPGPTGVGSPARASAPGAPARPALPAEPMRQGAPVRSGRIPEADRTYDWRGSLKRVDESGKPPGEAQAAPATAAAPGADADQGPGRPMDGLLELLRSELREVKDKVDMPTREIQVLKKEIKAMIDSVAVLRDRDSARPAPLPTQINPALSSGQASRQASPQAMAPRNLNGLADFASPGSLPPELRDLHAHLLDLDLDPDLASELAYATRAARGGDVAEAMAARIRTTGGVRLRPGKPSVVALVGPTGAGKTTTLCKLAALARMQQGKRVGILSADSFRMGANEQLELFGRTAGIPVRPLFSAADVAPALQEFAQCDLILLDTAGRSHAHPEAWVELQHLLRASGADEIHLVLSTTTRMRELLHQAGLYANLCRLAPACGVVFTKIDECVSLGCMYNLARRLDAPVSYVCDGQVIPDHIALATPRSVAARILSAVPAAPAPVAG